MGTNDRKKINAQPTEEYQYLNKHKLATSYFLLSLLKRENNGVVFLAFCFNRIILESRFSDNFCLFLKMCYQRMIPSQKVFIKSCKSETTFQISAEKSMFWKFLKLPRKKFFLKEMTVFIHAELKMDASKGRFSREFFRLLGEPICRTAMLLWPKPVHSSYSTVAIFQVSLTNITANYFTLKPLSRRSH